MSAELQCNLRRGWQDSWCCCNITSISHSTSFLILEWDGMRNHGACLSAALHMLAQVPRQKQGWGTQKVEVLLGPEVVCKCETDIFEEIGLAYVPPTMRFFHNYV